MGNSISSAGLSSGDSAFPSGQVASGQLRSRLRHSAKAPDGCNADGTF